MSALPRLMVAPTGARRSKADHPALPVTLPEIIDAARACAAAGADGLHLHLRDADGAHVLDAGLYREALAALHAALPGLAVQITTEAAGLYGPAHQRQVTLDSGAPLVSAAVREIAADTPPDIVAGFYAECATRGIAVQHILYDSEDLALLARLLPADLLRDPALQVIFVLGRYSRDLESDPQDLEPFLTALRTWRLSPDWAVCAFGRKETACLLGAHRAGGKLRVGFENSLWNADGRLAHDNTERVREVLRACAEDTRPI